MPMPEGGVYRILTAAGIGAPDVEFASAYEQARAHVPKRGPGVLGEVKLAVLDSGVYAENEPFYADRMAISGDAQGHTVSITHGRPVTAGTHGSHVASIAVSGTNRIKLVDVQVGRVQFATQLGPEVWRRALRWAVEQGARVVNVSVFCPWEDPTVHGLVKDSPNVLFLATSGNQSLNFPEDDAFRRAKGLDLRNIMLVGGCKNDGTRSALGATGKAVDIYGPSVNVPGYVALRTVAKKEKLRRNAEVAVQVAKNNADKQEAFDAATQRLQAQATGTGASAQAAQQKLAARQPFVPEAVPRLKAKQILPTLFPGETNTNDTGVSFAIPMVANVAAKMILIDPALKPQEIIAIMRVRSVTLEAGRVLDPVACYNTALESLRAR